MLAQDAFFLKSAFHEHVGRYVMLDVGDRLNSMHTQVASKLDHGRKGFAGVSVPPCRLGKHIAGACPVRRLHTQTGAADELIVVQSFNK